MKEVQVQGVILDWAGTMIDYGCFAPVAAFVEMFKLKGIEVTSEEVRKPMGLLKRDHLLAICNMERVAALWKEKYGRLPDEADIDEMYAGFEKLLFEVLPEYTTPIPGALELVERLRSKGIKIGSTTGYTKEMMKVVTAEANKRGYAPDTFVCPDDTMAGRPYPWMSYENAKRLGVYPMKALVKVGDTLSDIAEGLNAGMWSVGILKGSNELGMTEAEVEACDPSRLQARLDEIERQFREAGAHYVIETIGDLDAVLEEVNVRLARGESPDLLLPRNPYLLLTPGPLTTTPTVKAAMLSDWCTWDRQYNEVVQSIRSKLVRLATRAPANYTTVLMQGSGTFVVESVIGSVIPYDGKLAVLANGAYGDRIAKMAKVIGIKTVVIDFGETSPVDGERLDAVLLEQPDITHVAVVHTETTTGMLNSIEEIGRVANRHGKVYIVDAMSSFGGIELDVADIGIDFLISSSNKCIQGVPGFGFVIAKKTSLEQCAGRARSLSLDLYDQWDTMEREGGKWRFTSPTHVVYAFNQALLEIEQEGGIAVRQMRFTNNQKTLAAGMARAGFRALLPEEHQSPIITSFYYPESDSFSFKELYERIKQEGFVIYPGKISTAPTFRIGNIGDVNAADMERLARTIERIRFW